jgi:hypothetical protein
MKRRQRRALCTHTVCDYTAFYFNLSLWATDGWMGA